MITASCGGSAEETTTTAAEPATGAVPTTVAGPTDTTVAAPAAETTTTGGEIILESSATVTIGDETWEFAPTGFMTERCDTDFSGGFWVLFTTGVAILLPGENWEAQGVDQTPNVQIKLQDEGVEWVADPDTSLPGVVAGQSQIDSFEFDGNRASGTATFVEANAAYAGTVQPVSGTFEAVCASEDQ
jgi:hypothetical protein